MNPLTSRTGDSVATDPVVDPMINVVLEQASKIGQGKFERFAKWAASIGDLAAIRDQISEAPVSDPDEIELMSQALLLAELRGRLETQAKAESRKPKAESSAGEPAGLPAEPPALPLTQYSALSTQHSLTAHAELFSVLQFAEAIKALADRLGITKDKFLELDGGARSKAFTMARVADENVLFNIHDEIVQTINDGETYAQFEKRLADVQDRTGWTGSDPWHYRLVYDQNLGMAFTAGRYSQGTENGLKAWRYLPSISDEPRPDHLIYYNQIFKAAPGRPMPPWDFNCACGWEWMMPDDPEMDGVDVASLPEFDPPTPASGYNWEVGEYMASKAETPKAESRNGESGMHGTLIVCEAVGVDGLPDRVMLAPWGQVQSKAGDFLMDEQSAAAIAAAFTAHATDLPIDYEHQSMGGEFASPTGQAPAAGWIKAIESQPGVGLFGRVEWTPPGRERIANREYRYLSPVVLVRAMDGRAIALHSAALTNKPAIAGMTPIVNKAETPKAESRNENPPWSPLMKGGKEESEPSAALRGAEIHTFACTENNSMATLRDKARQIAQSPNLTPQDKVTQVLALIDAEPHVTVHKDALSVLATELGEDGKGLATAVEAGDAAKLGEAVKLVANKVQHPTGVVPASEYQALAEQVKALTQRETERELDLLIQANSAKLPPAEREGFKVLYHKAPEFAKTWLASQPDRVLTRSVNSGGTATGNERELKIVACRNQLRGDAGEGRILLGTERDAVNGLLIADGFKGITEEEANKFSIR